MRKGECNGPSDVGGRRRTPQADPLTEIIKQHYQATRFMSLQSANPSWGSEGVLRKALRPVGRPVHPQPRGTHLLRGTPSLAPAPFTTPGGARPRSNNSSRTSDLRTGPMAKRTQLAPDGREAEVAKWGRPPGERSSRAMLGCVDGKTAPSLSAAHSDA